MPSNARPNVYISGPLQAAVDLVAARTFYEALAATCRGHGCDPYLPHQRSDPITHVDVDARSVFLRDLRSMQFADLIVAYVGAPSSGVGAELGIAFERGIPIIALCGPEGTASRFVAGMIEEMPESLLLSYATDVECHELLGDALDRFRATRTVLRSPPRVVPTPQLGR